MVVLRRRRPQGLGQVDHLVVAAWRRPDEVESTRVEAMNVFLAPTVLAPACGSFDRPYGCDDRSDSDGRIVSETFCSLIAADVSDSISRWEDE